MILVLRKGVFPYEYWDSPTKAAETELPPLDAFYSRLTGENASQTDYEHGQKVWNEFGIENLGQYHDLYLKTDVTILADVFEKFRTMCLQYYELDAAHYYSIPEFEFEATLKMTGVKLELMKDRQIQDIIEKVRISHASTLSIYPVVNVVNVCNTSSSYCVRAGYERRYKLYITQVCQGE